MINQRTHSGEVDKVEMIQLAREFQAEHLHLIDLPYQLSSWALDEPDNIGLWVDEDGHLVAWAVMQTPFWTIENVLRPDLKEKYTSIFWIGWTSMHMPRSTHPTGILPSL
jgi:hypothetical protein